MSQKMSSVTYKDILCNVPLLKCMPQKTQGVFHMFLQRLFYSTSCNTILLPANGLPCREFILARAQRWQQREAFRRTFHRRHPLVAMRYPVDLLDLPPFATWLTEKVKTLLDASEDFNDDVLQYTQPPERFATSHRQMYAFGMHLRIRSVEGGLVTRDSGVVASFTQQLRWGLHNGRPMERTDDYVGYIEEILELDYRNHCTTILVCDWVRATQDPRFPNL